MTSQIVVPLVGVLDQRVTTVVGAVPSVSTQICPSLGDDGSVGCAREPATTAQLALVPSVVRNSPALPVCDGRLSTVAQDAAEPSVVRYLPVWPV